MLSVYFDTCEALRVFEHQRRALLPRLDRAIRAGRLKLILSDVVIVESVKGLGEDSPRSVVEKGLDTMHRLAAHRIHLNSLRDEELRGAVEGWRTAGTFTPLSPFLSWPDLAALMWPENPSMARALTPAFFARANGRAAKPLFARQQEQLSGAAADEGRAVIKGAPKLAAATKRLFMVLTTEDPAVHDAGLTAEDAVRFAEAVWRDGNACPSWRMGISETARTLRDLNHQPTLNDHMDVGHAGAAPYVGAFVSGDAHPRRVVARFNETVRRSPGHDPVLVVDRLEDVPGF